MLILVQTDSIKLELYNLIPVRDLFACARLLKHQL